MMKVVALLLFVTLTCINAKRSLDDLTLEDISGKWVASGPNAIVTIFVTDDEFGVIDRGTVCRDVISPECEEVIPDVDVEYLIDANAMTFDYKSSETPDATTPEVSETLYPACFESGTTLRFNSGNAIVDILGYEKSNLEFESGGFEGCLKWKVFIDGHKVKAHVIRDIDVTVIAGNFPPFFPSTCTADDYDKKFDFGHDYNFEFPDSKHFKPFESEYEDMISSFKNKKDKEETDECSIEPNAEAGELSVKYVLEFEFECISGSCKDLSKKYGYPKGL